MEKQIIIEGKKGKLFGVLHIVEKEKSPGVILFHGCTGNKCESHFIFTKLARSLCKEGISVLRFDFYGSGDSEGEFGEMSLYTEMDDGESAFEYFKNLDFIDNNKIGVLGLSMGTIIATYIAWKFNQVKALCLWSPLAYPSILNKKIITRKIKRKIEENGKVYVSGIGHFIGKDFVKSCEEVKMEKFAQEYKGNVFIIHTKDDSLLDLNHPLFYFKNFHKNTFSLKMMVFDKGGHTFTTEESEKTVIEETVSFFKEIFGVQNFIYQRISEIHQ